MPNKFKIELQGLSVDEFDGLSVVLNRHADQVEGHPRGVLTTEALTAVGATLTFLWANRNDIKEGLKLAEELITWVQQLVKRRSDAKPAAAETQIVLVRPDQVKLDLLRATPDEVRRYFLDNPDAR